MEVQVHYKCRQCSLIIKKGWMIFSVKDSSNPVSTMQKILKDKEMSSQTCSCGPGIHGIADAIAFKFISKGD